MTTCLTIDDEVNLTNVSVMHFVQSMFGALYSIAPFKKRELWELKKGWCVLEGMPSIWFLRQHYHNKPLQYFGKQHKKPRKLPSHIASLEKKLSVWYLLSQNWSLLSSDYARKRMKERQYHNCLDDIHKEITTKIT